MTPKNKAKQLINKFEKDAEFWDCYNDEPYKTKHDINCAIILVNEILEFEQLHDWDFWSDVKQELRLLY